MLISTNDLCHRYIAVIKMKKNIKKIEKREFNPQLKSMCHEFSVFNVSDAKY